MDINNLRDAYKEGLADMYSAEKQLTEALPKLAEKAKSRELKQALTKHLEQTQNHMEIVGQLVQQAGAGRKTCEAMKGLVKEGSEIAAKDGDRDARDAAMIGAAQKVEHYEIASYGTLRTWAQVLGEQDAAQRLQQILDQEYEADQLLNRIAEGYLNEQAAD